jgi:hypothetical protein
MSTRPVAVTCCGSNPQTSMMCLKESLALKVVATYSGHLMGNISPSPMVYKGLAWNSKRWPLYLEK